MKTGTILICDDNDLILTMISFILRPQGFTVETAGSTEEVYRTIDKNKPALIFLDLNLPQDGGESVVHQLRSRAETADIPVILFSAVENLAEVSEKLKVNGFLRKPFENEEVIAIARRFVRVA
jgi:DNA-binding response OmpR family regulator